MQFSSPLIASVQSVLGAGSELQIPELLLPTVQLPFPLQTNRVGQSIDLRGTFASINTTMTINQPASTAAQNGALCIFDRGLYRIRATIGTVTFGGPAASSASILCGFLALSDPTQTVYSRIALTGLVPLSTWIADQCDITVQFNVAGWLLIGGTFVATGVGQSIGVEAAANISRLL